MIEINENFSLKEYNTFGIDVTCKYFVKCDQESELLEFVGSYELDPEEILLLGGGSNFLFTENFDGVVFYPVMQGCEIVREDDKYVFVRVGSGVVWDDFVAWAVEHGYGGVAPTWPGTSERFSTPPYPCSTAMWEQPRCRISGLTGWKSGNVLTGWKPWIS